MSRRGHKTGIISTYFHTWLLNTDKKGCVFITPAVSHAKKGTSTRVSVTEVRQVNVTSQPRAGQILSRAMCLCVCGHVCVRMCVCV